MITTKQIEIPKTRNLTSDYIETELSKMNIEPLRWAIVDVLKDKYVLSVSYDGRFLYSK